MKLYISTASTLNHDYLFYIPIKAWVHKQLHQAETVCYLVGDDMNPFKFVMNYGEGIKHYIGMKPQGNPVTYSQLIRLYGFFDILPENSRVMVSDADLIMFRLPKPGVNIYGANLVNGDQYPMQYTCFSTEQWQKILKDWPINKVLMRTDAQSKDFNQYWFTDQRFLKERIQESDIAPVIENRPLVGGLPIGRLDRAAWDVKKRNVIDSHLLRPGYTDENFSKLMLMLGNIFGKKADWINEYRNQYIKHYELPI